MADSATEMRRIFFTMLRFQTVDRIERSLDNWKIDESGRMPERQDKML